MKVALVTPNGRINRTARAATARLPGVECVRMSLERYAADRDAPLAIVLCPVGADARTDIQFLAKVRRRLLRPLPSSEVWGAIAGMRGSHDPPPPGSRSARGRSRRTALLLEGDVTLDRARRAAASDAPRDWIVERVQRVRVGAGGLGELDRLGVRWSVFDPVRVHAVVAAPALLRAQHRWKTWFPGAAIWKVDSSE